MSGEAPTAQAVASTFLATARTDEPPDVATLSLDELHEELNRMTVPPLALLDQLEGDFEKAGQLDQLSTLRAFIKAGQIGYSEVSRTRVSVPTYGARCVPSAKRHQPNQ